VLLFFSVARSATAGQAERASEAPRGAVIQATPPSIEIDTAGDGLPTDRLVDISAQALRMSSPFNAGYWLSAA